jgi:hypothetical protein
MPKTMAYRITGEVMVLRHADAAPDPKDWDAFIEAFVHAPVGKLLVWSPGMASPDSAQRASAVAAFRSKGERFRASIMTGSRLARGAATAISWFGPKLHGFGLDDLSGALDYLEVATNTRAALQATVEALGDEVTTSDSQVG